MGSKGVHLSPGWLCAAGLSLGAAAGPAQGQNVTYGYDALGRLTTVTRSDGTSAAYTYDPAGNRTFVSNTSQTPTPNPFDLGPPVTNAVAGAPYTSASATLSGFSGSAPISVSGGQYRINGGPWTTAPGTVVAGQSVQVQALAPATVGATQTVTLTVGTVSDTFQVTTAAADATPDPVNWSNLSGSTTSNVILSSASFQQVTGINQPINIRVQISNVSGNLSSFQQYVHYNPAGSTGSAGGPWTDAVVGGGGYIDFTIQPGQWIYFDAGAETYSGARSGGWTVTVTNLTTGVVLDTFTVALSVDTDNNYNVSDLTPDPVDWSNLAASSTADVALTSASFGQITGIDQPITLRVQVSNLTGNLSLIQQGIHYNPPGSPGSSGGPWAYAAVTANNGYVDITVQPGQWVYFDAAASTTSGARAGSWTVTVTNLSTGVVLDTFGVSISVDTDNDYNTADTTPDPVDWANLSASSASEDVLSGASFQQINGIDQSIILRVQISNLSGDLDGIQQHVHYNPAGAPGSSGGPWAWTPLTANYAYVDISIAPGQWIYFDASATGAFTPKSGSWTVTVTNLTTGAILDTFNVTLAVGQ